VVPKLWHHHAPFGAVVVDVGARQAGVGQARHIALADVLRLLKGRAEGRAAARAGQGGREVWVRVRTLSMRNCW
jgi:hypothetical protein